MPPCFQLRPVSTLCLHVLDGERPDQQIDPLGVPQDFWVQGKAVHEVLPGSECGSKDVLLRQLEGALDNGHHGVDGGRPRVQVATHQPHKHLPSLEHCHLYRMFKAVKVKQNHLTEILIFQHGFEGWHEFSCNEV